jgi:hypothetical protein
MKLVEGKSHSDIPLLQRHFAGLHDGAGPAAEILPVIAARSSRNIWNSSTKEMP